jgi:flagellar biosynthesis/type III secretory pathway chaperone
MSAVVLHPALEVTLTEEISVCREFLDTLMREHEALLGTDLNVLADVTRSKLVLIERLHDMSSERERLLRKCRPVDGDGRSVPERIRRGESGDSVQALWLRLESLLAECGRRNSISARVLQQRLQHARAALGILCGQPLETALYSRKGVESATMTRSLTLA